MAAASGSPAKKSRSSLVDHAFPSFYACYLLKSHRTPTSSATYIGSTPHPPRRIRQHNGEIQGGAHKTKHGRPWTMNMLVYGFPSKLAALQFEWAWQHPERTRHLRAVRAAGSVFKRGGPRSLAKNALVARLMLALHPYNLWPLHVKLFTTAAMAAWAEAARSTPPLPTGLSVQIELEGVDGKSGQSGSGRPGPLDVTDDVFTKAHLTKYAGMLETAAAHACDVCSEAIDLNTADTLQLAICPRDACTSVSHLACLARAFTAADSSASATILPRGGACPSCAQYVLWGDIVKGCYRRRNGAALQLAEDDGTTPKKRTRKKAADDGPDVIIGSEELHDSAPEQTPVPSKKRGRPPKTKTKQATFALDEEAFARHKVGESSTAGAGGGRAAGKASVPASSTVPKRRGRPPKAKVVQQSDEDEGEFFDLDAVSGTGSDSESEAEDPIPGPKKLGRPPKAKPRITVRFEDREVFDLDAVSSSSSEAAPPQPAISKKPSSRAQMTKPASAVQEPEPVLTTKRPRGRPRTQIVKKNTSSTRGGHASESGEEFFDLAGVTSGSDDGHVHVPEPARPPGDPPSKFGGGGGGSRPRAPVPAPVPDSEQTLSLWAPSTSRAGTAPGSTGPGRPNHSSTASSVLHRNEAGGGSGPAPAARRVQERVGAPSSSSSPPSTPKPKSNSTVPAKAKTKANAPTVPVASNHSAEDDQDEGVNENDDFLSFITRRKPKPRSPAASRDVIDLT